MEWRGGASPRPESVASSSRSSARGRGRGRHSPRSPRWPPMPPGPPPFMGMAPPFGSFPYMPVSIFGSSIFIPSRSGVYLRSFSLFFPESK